jgi:flagellin-like hook-associated protein FlgL
VFQGAGTAGGVGILDAVQDLERVLNGNSSPNAISLAINLDAGLSPGTGFSPADAVGTQAPAATFTSEADFSTPVAVFDSKGQAHNLTFLFAKTGATTFKYRVVANADEITGGTPGDSYQVAPEGILEFNVNGTLNSAASSLKDITLANFSDQASDITITASDLSFSGSTHVAQPSAVFSLTQTNTNGIQTQLGRLDAAMAQISLFRSEIGARLTSAQTASTAVTVLHDHALTRRSAIEDVDALAAYSDFARLQQAFQAALQSAAQMIQPSLLDFLK